MPSAPFDIAGHNFSRNAENFMTNEPINPKEENSSKKEDHFEDRWKNPEKNKMGNDITGDVKVANSGGELEGGDDKRWHLKEDDQD